MIPRTLGRYEIFSLLGEGGMGRVYKARDPMIERTVAIKTLAVELAEGQLAEFKERFFREARSAGRVSHPSVVTIFDVGESDGVAFIAMEYVEGATLRAVLDAGAPLAVAEACRIGARMAGALAAAHKHGIVHRDVKPGNIMIGAEDTVKLMDFGIARLPDGMRTKTGLIVGSPTYLAPEQIVGRGADARSDIYALGVVLYEMLTGVPPFRKDNVTELLNAIVNERHAFRRCSSAFSRARSRSIRTAATRRQASSRTTSSAGGPCRGRRPRSCPRCGARRSASLSAGLLRNDTSGQIPSCSPGREA
jgi:serine/threonine-protein kinase